MKSMLKGKLLLIGIILIASLLRLWQLDKIPTGISDDELIYVLNAKAVFLTGKDLTGTWSPFSLTPIPSEFPVAEIPYLIIAPFIGLFPLSLFMARFPYAIISTLSVTLLYLITAKLVGKKEALFVGLVNAFNPWSIFFGRTAYEAPLAIFFYLLAFYLLIILKGWKILFTFIPLFIGFYSYIGTKLIFIPFVVMITFYSWYIINKKKFVKQFIALFTLCLLLFLFFIFTVKGQSTNSRLSEISTPNNSIVSITVDNERRLSIETPFTKFFSNKFIVWSKDSIDKYLRVFSTDFLFLHGEGRSTYSLWYHGYFYYLDIFFLLIGFSFLFAQKKKVWLLFFALILISPLPTVASTVGSQFAALRSALLYPLLIILIGTGISTIFFLYKNTKYRIFVSALLILLYGIQTFNFINIYFFRNPIYNSEAYNLSSRIISKYISLTANNGIKVTVISNSPKSNFKHYLFETNSYTTKNAAEIKELINQNNFKLNNADFIICSSEAYIPQDHTIIAIADKKCSGIDFSETMNSLIIPQLSDGGAIFKIVNDGVCKKYKLGRFPYNISLSDLSIENLSEKRFCEKFIIDPNSKQ